MLDLSSESFQLFYCIIKKYSKPKRDFDRCLLCFLILALDYHFEVLVKIQNGVSNYEIIPNRLIRRFEKVIMGIKFPQEKEFEDFSGNLEILKQRLLQNILILKGKEKPKDVLITRFNKLINNKTISEFKKMKNFFKIMELGAFNLLSSMEVDSIDTYS